jgi:DinB superfamily
MRPEANMRSVEDLIMEVAEARRTLIAAVANLTPAQASFKPAPEEWSVLENIEHTVLAEVSGVSKIWLAANNFRDGVKAFTGEHTNRGLSIEEVVARTWKQRRSHHRSPRRILAGRCNTGSHILTPANRCSINWGRRSMDWILSR